jgi:hypothetical protein
LWLWYRSHEGREPVTLTSASAADAGLDRPGKLRRLRQLEARGLITVVRSGKRAPLITVRSVLEAGSNSRQH